MCIIASSPAGVRQPTETELRRMFAANRHGAGYMVARNGTVSISKGYMDIESYLKAIRAEHFTAADPVVYHMRISTQGGINPEQTHPFPLSDQLSDLTELEISSCPVGIAHNGIIHLTTDRNDHYSDTIRFIQQYLVKLLRTSDDLRDPAIHRIIYELTHSRLAIMDGSGYIAHIGHWITEDCGLLFSNSTYLPVSKFTFGGVKGKRSTTPNLHSTL